LFQHQKAEAPVNLAYTSSDQLASIINQQRTPIAQKRQADPRHELKEYVAYYSANLKKAQKTKVRRTQPYSKILNPEEPESDRVSINAQSMQPSQFQAQTFERYQPY